MRNNLGKRYPSDGIGTLQQVAQYYRVPIVIILFGIGLSIWGFVFALSQNFTQLESNFTTYSENRYNYFNYHINAYLRGMEIATASLQELPQVTKKRLGQIVSPLMLRSQFYSFLWFSKQENGQYAYKFSHFRNSKKQTSHDPLNNLTIIREAMDQAQKTKQPVITKAARIFSNKKYVSVVVIVSPVFSKNNQLSFLVGILDIHAVFSREMNWAKKLNDVKVYIYDITGPEKQLIYANSEKDTSLHIKKGDPQGLIWRGVPFLYEKKLSLLSRDWHIFFIPTHKYLAKAADIFPWTVLGLVLSLTFLISLFVFSLVTRNLRIKNKVEQQTKELLSLAEILAESENKIRAIVDTTVDGIITINEKGVVESYNQACTRIFGYSANDVIGKNIRKLMPEPYHSEHNMFLQNYQDTNTPKIIGIGREVQGLRQDGTVFPIDLAVSHVQLDSRVIYCGIIRDITERKKIEKELHNTLDLLSKSNKELEQFAYVSSHDLKSPLRAIDQLAVWIEEDLGSNLHGEVKENLDTLRGRVKRMETLLDDLLEYSRAGRNVNVKQNSSLSGHQMLEEIKLLLNIPKNFNIIATSQFSSMQLYKIPLQQVLLNLIGNAIKHHDKEKGEITVSVEDADREIYKFIIKDDGPGIQKKFHEKVFEMFQTLQSRDKVEGSGMGLALVKKIVNSRGGEVYIQSGNECGTEVIFTWPVNLEGEGA